MELCRICKYKYAGKPKMDSSNSVFNCKNYVTVQVNQTNVFSTS